MHQRDVHWAGTNWTTRYWGLRAASLPELLERLRLAVAHRRSWPEFWVPTRDEIRPRVIDGKIQCWLGTPEMGERDPGNVDFWRRRQKAACSCCAATSRTVPVTGRAIGSSPEQ